MAKRKTKSKINKSHIVEAFAEMARQKSIDRDLLQGIMEDTFAQMVRKKYGPDAEFDIIVNMDKGDIEIYLIREVVEEPEDHSLQIALSEANEEEEDYELGDEHLTELNLENLAENFGRRMISMAGQTLSQRVREVEKENIISEYSEKVGEIIVGEVYQVRRNDVYVQHNRVELRMPRSEQIWRERYKKGETIRALMKEVRSEEGTSSQPEIIISRSDPMFLHKLMEIEIPEIYDGIIEIKSIAREPGERAKVAVLSNDERVDPVGACVGMKGVRIHSIVRELSNESIDVIPYDPDPKTFISRALSPAKIKEIAIDDDTRTATVLVADDQVSLAIGRGGQNVRLAMKLTGFTIDLVKEGGEDIELIEFKDELGESLYESLIMLDIETAKEFLRFDEHKLLEIEGMTAKKLREIRGIMIVEFDENELRDILPHLSLDAVLPGEENASEEAPTPEQAAEEAADSAVAESGSESAPEAETSTPTDESAQASETAGNLAEEETTPTTTETTPVVEGDGESTSETEGSTTTDESAQAGEAAGDVAEEKASPEDSVESENAKTSEENVSEA
ncbi:MAG: transcription termination factor NusA [Ignavibacteriae bacterium]|nr:transcription termination factor NusA [Ignavibacteriota bacterium]MCB9214525.1 transcription termination factor NusA [Ignavibacteria bacterium]